MRGIVSYASYLPYWRLDRAQVAAALGVPAGRGTRSVASYDEDTTTIGVEAARAALAAAPERARPGALFFATADPAYLDKTNATAIHAALALDASVGAFDMVGAVRSGVGAMAAAVGGASCALVVLSDMRSGLPGSVDEVQGGDGAAAFLVGDTDVIAEHLATASTSAEFLDRWRLPGDDHSRVWEERFGEHAYVPSAEQSFGDALKQAGLTPDDVDRLVVCGVHPRAARAVIRGAGVRAEAIVADRSEVIGNAGTAQPGIVLADVLDRARPGDVIAVVVLADGASTTLWRATDALAGHRRAATIDDQLAVGRADLAYPTFLTWRGQLHREPPRRPDPVAPAAPPSLRHASWKYGFAASRCVACGMRHLPPCAVCVNCGAVDQMVEERLADVRATIATYTVDRLAFTPSPPLVAAVVDFDGGGRYRCELTDVDPASVAIGDRVEMTFRRIATAQGIHNYFWKARPIRSSKEA